MSSKKVTPPRPASVGQPAGSGPLGISFRYPAEIVNSIPVPYLLGGLIEKG